MVGLVAVRYGLVCYGMVWYFIVWYGMVLYGEVYQPSSDILRQRSRSGGGAGSGGGPLALVHVQAPNPPNLWGEGPVLVHYGMYLH